MEKRQDILYYDGSCPLCTAEMRRLARLKDDSMALVNIHEIELAASRRKEMLEILHLEQSDGALLTGLDANVAAWQHTRWGFAFRWLRWPLIRVVADAVYRVWARRRYNRLYVDRACGAEHV